MSAVDLTAIRDETILVTGASGLLGRQIVFELVKRGVRPVCLVRDSSDTRYLDSLGLELRRADLRNHERVVAAFDGINRVIHAAGLVNFRGDKLTQFTGINSFGALSCYRAAQAVGASRFVHISSIVAVGAAPLGGAPVNEEVEFPLGDLCIPYVQSKREAENLLLAEADPRTELVIVNPTISIAPSRHSSDRARIERFLSRRFIPALPNRFNLADIRDVVEAIVNALALGRHGSRYLLTCENIAVSEVYDYFCELTGLRPRGLRPPRWALEIAARLARRAHRRKGGKLRLYPDLVKVLDFDWVYDNTQARKELEFTPRPLRQSLEDLYHGRFSETFLDTTGSTPCGQTS